MSTQKQNLGKFLFKQMAERQAVIESLNEDFKDAFWKTPSHFLYEMAPGAPYSQTRPGTLVVLCPKDPYPDPKLTDDGTFEKVTVWLVSDGVRWFKVGDVGPFYVEPRYMKRVDPSDLGISVAEG